jgi:uncharacterized protein
LAAGALLGALGGLLGIGGGLFAIPMLALWFGLDQQHAQGTALVMVVPNVATGLWSYARKGGLDRRLGLALAASALPLTYVGAHVATHVASTPLRLAFAAFVLAIGVFTAYRARVRTAADGTSKRAYPWQWAFVVGAFGGLVSGLFGVGGAVFSVPLMSYMFGLTQAAAQGLGLALVAPGTLVGIVTYALAADVDWARGIPLALGGIATVPLGVRLAYRLPDRSLRLAFAALMFVAAFALIAHA